MNTRANKTLLAAALVSASATLGLGCAGILGADFDRSFSDGGGSGGAGGASASASDVSAIAASGAGGAGGAGGEVAKCITAEGQSEDRCTINVYVKLGPPSDTTSSSTLDAIMTFDINPPEGFAMMPTSTFTLSRASTAFEDAALYSCEQNDGTHTYAWGNPCSPGKLLGYVAKDSQTGYEPLVWFTTGNGLGKFDNRRALIAQKDNAQFCGSSTVPLPVYGTCEDSTYYAAK
jgi:hypothetical protein